MNPSHLRRIHIYSRSGPRFHHTTVRSCESISNSDHVYHTLNGRIITSFDKKNIFPTKYVQTAFFPQDILYMHTTEHTPDGFVDVQTAEDFFRRTITEDLKHKNDTDRDIRIKEYYASYPEKKNIIDEAVKAAQKYDREVLAPENEGFCLKNSTTCM